MRKLRILAFSIAAFAISAGGANAYTAYLKPADFSPDGGAASIEAAFAQQFFTPTVGLASDFKAFYPDGAQAPFRAVRVGNPTTTLELSAITPGTYRVSTGDVLGQVANMVAHEGSWRALAAGEAPPEGVDTSTLQTVTLSETYFTRGAPTNTVLQAPGGRLAIRPITHPNQVLVASGFQVELLFDGAPFPNMPFVLYAAGDPDTKVDRVFVTDAAGRATLTVDAPGAYVAAVRHRAPAPTGAAAAVQSYTTSLTFEALTALPEYPAPVEERGRRRRNRD